jgi:hypothetical protein
MTPRQQLDAFIDKYSPEVAKKARALFAKMRKKYPKATVLVYDNYNALAIGFAPGEKTSAAVFSLALYPRWVSLFFLHGAAMPDPNKRLMGSGKQVRHIVMEPVELWDDPEIQALMELAAEDAGLEKGTGEIVIRSISGKQRPRR